MPSTIVSQSLLLLTLCALPALGGAEIFKWVDEHGVTHYGEKPQADRAAETVTLEPRPATTQDADTTERLNSVAESLRQSRLSKEQSATDIAKREQLASQIDKLANLSALGGNWNAGGDLEAQCQAQYGQGCDALINWKENARTQCRTQRTREQYCSDDAYLARKYFPQTIEQQRKIGICSRFRR